MSNFPYPGLRPFKTEENDIYFGRDEFITKLTERISKEHFIAVLGDSGCGKSSLVRAGLLSHLSLVKVGGRYHWCSAVMRPAKNPFYCLAADLLRDFGKDSVINTLNEAYCKKYKLKEISENEIKQLQQELEKDSKLSCDLLEELLKSMTTSDNYSLLIVVDQFEELFLQTDRQVAEKFIQWLLQASHFAKSRIYVVITMRTEFLDDCARYSQDLLSAINEGFFQIPYLNPKQIAETIEYPARMRNGEVEPALVKRLVSDVQAMGDDSYPDQLPLLQHTLVNLWMQVANTKEKKLTLQHYTQGSLAEALTNTADEIYDYATDNGKKLIEILFRRISRKDGTSNYSRYPVVLADIAALAGTNVNAVSTVADDYQRLECNFLFAQNKSEKGYLQADSRVDIRHESIIRQWQRLKEWTDDEAKTAKRYKQWEDAACEWEQGNGELRHGRYLEITEILIEDLRRLYPSDAQLKLWASRYGEHFDLAWEFLEKSREAEEELRCLAEKAEKREIQRQLELKDRKEREQLALDKERVALEKEELAIKERQVAFDKLIAARRLRNVAIASTIIIALVATWGFRERDRALEAEKIALAAEQARAESLFNSYIQHSSLLARYNQYAQARNVLNQSYPLDEKIQPSPRHVRNLLDGFINISLAQEKQNYSGAKAPLHRLAISQDKKQLAAVGENATIVLFDAITGNLLKRFNTEQSTTLKAVQYHPNNLWLITAGEDGKITIWSLETAQPVKQWDTGKPISALVLNNKGDLIASAGDDNKIILWNTEGQVQNPDGLDSGQTDRISSLTFSHDDTMLASTAYDNTTHLWKMPTGERIRQFSAHTDHVQKAIFSPDDKLLVTASDDKTIKFWEIDSGKAIKTLNGHQDEVFSLNFIQNGSYLVSGSADSTLRIWDVDSGVTVKVLEGHTGFVNDIDYDGTYIYSASNDGSIKKWDSKLAYQYRINVDKPATATVIAPDGDKIAVGFENGSLELRTFPEGQLLATQETPHERDVQRIAFSPNNQFMASASLDQTAKIWKIENNQLDLLGTINHQAGVNAVTFSPDGKTVVTASYDGNMGYFALDSQKTQFIPLYQKNQEMNSIVWQQDKILTTSDNQAYLWQQDQWQKSIFSYPKTQDVTMWAALSPDLQTTALVGRDFIVRIYQGEQSYELLGHKQAVIRAEFSPDSQQLFTVSADNTVHAWNLLQRNKLFSIELPTYGKNAVWDFDFHCIEPGCWIVVPSAENNDLMLYELGKIY
jgi:WD40 repeat protein/energy-coupling factor transporter ATP-binding protein EcfA2